MSSCWSIWWTLWQWNDGWASYLNSSILCMYCFPCKFSSGQLRLSDLIGSKIDVLQYPLGFPEACLKRRNSGDLKYFGVLLLVLSRCKLSSANNSRLHFLWQLFYNAFFQRRLVLNDGLDSVCQNSLLRCGQVNSVFCSLRRCSMNFTIHLPRFLSFCNYFCFAGIVVETYQELVHLLYVLFLLLPVQLLQQSNDLDPRKNELYSCKESSTWLLSLGGKIISPECPWIARKKISIFPSSSLQISNLFWSFCGKRNVTNPHMWIFLPIDYGMLYTSHSQNWECGILTVSHFFSFHFHHGFEVDLLEDEGFKGMFSSRLASKNCHPNSVLSKGVGLCPQMYWHRIAAAAAAAAAAFRRGRDLPASWRQRFPDARLKIHIRFNVDRILWASPVIYHGRLWRFATQIIEVLVPFAQWWTVLHNSRLVKIHFSHSEIFNDCTCTGGWFWIHSRNISLMTTVNHFVNGCTNQNFLPLFMLHRSPLEVRVQLLHLGLIISTLEIALTNIPRDVLVLMSTREIAPANILRDVLVLLNVADVHQCNKVDFLTFLLFCAFFMTSFHSAFSSRINIAWSERSFIHTSRFPEACVSERQISRVFWTTRNSRFPKFADQNNIRSSYFFLPDSHLRVSCAPRIFRFTWRILSHRYAVPRDDIICACFHLQRESSEELSWDLFIGTNSCVQL